MRDRLVEKSSDIRIGHVNFPIRFVAPHWAKSFECKAGICGLCCLVELPRNVPRKHLNSLDRAICGFYNIEQRKCSKYSQRPFGCRVYPFFFGVEEGTILTSTMLGCPATNYESEINPRVLVETFSDSSVFPIVLRMHEDYDRAKRDNNLWKDADHVWPILSNTATNFLSQRTGFPFVSQFKDLMLNTVDDLLEIPKAERRHFSIPSMKKLVSGIARSYIATRFSSCKVYSMKVRGSKILVISFDTETDEVKRIKIETPSKSPVLEIERDARNILEDYVALLLKRPFLSLATRSLVLFPTCVPFLLSDSLVGSIAPLEVAATIIASRDSLTTVNADSMREIISLSEASVISMFRRPDISVWNSS